MAKQGMMRASWATVLPLPLTISFVAPPHLQSFTSLPWPAQKLHGGRNDVMAKMTSHPLSQSVNDSETKENNLVSVQDFFNREVEIKNLVEWLQQKPHKVLLLVGPRSSGKSSLLRYVFATDEDKLVPPLFLDGRARSIGDATQLAYELQNAGDGWLQQGGTKKLLGDSAPRLAESLSLKDFVRAEQSESLIYPSPVNQALGWYEKAITEVRRRDPALFPIIVIDEANLLMTWKQLFPDDLKALLNFFILVSKQQQVAHVILATSDNAFYTWLTSPSGIHPSSVQRAVIGDFSKADAQRFAETCFKSTQFSPGWPLTSEEWERIYDVCGGNAQDLSAAMNVWARKLHRHEVGEADFESRIAKVEEILRLDIWSLRYSRLKNAVKKSPSFKQAATLLCESEYGAVLASDVIEQLASWGGEEELYRLLSANLITMRPPSDWTFDLPAEVFGAVSEDVVTPESAVSWFCLRRLKAKGLLASGSEEKRNL